MSFYYVSIEIIDRHSRRNNRSKISNSQSLTTNNDEISLYSEKSSFAAFDWTNDVTVILPMKIYISAFWLADIFLLKRATVRRLV